MAAFPARRRLVLVLPVVLAACGGPRAEFAERARTALVGLPEAELYACAGVPERMIDAGGQHLLAYRRDRTLVTRDVDYEEVPFLRSRGVPVVRPEVSYRTAQFACEATFTVENGVVRRVEYAPGRDIQLCYQIVANCPVPGPGAGG